MKTGELIRYHLSGLTHFAGRQPRQPFWIWTALVMVLSMAGMFAVMIPVLVQTFQRVQRFAIEHPDQVTVTEGPGSRSVQIHGYHPELMPDFVLLIGGVGAVSLVVVALLAAAVTRRLHDSGKRGWWGLVPLPFLASGLLLMPQLIANGEPDLGLFALLFANNLVYIASLIVLVVMLAARGNPHDNRFGPPPPV